MRNGSIVHIADKASLILIKIIKFFNASSKGSAKIGSQILVTVHLYSHLKNLKYTKVLSYGPFLIILLKMEAKKNLKGYLKNLMSIYYVGHKSLKPRYKAVKITYSLPPGIENYMRQSTNFFKKSINLFTYINKEKILHYTLAKNIYNIIN